MSACRHCGKEVGADAINGLCPACLMKVGIESEVGPAPSASSGPQATAETRANTNTFAPPPNAPLSIGEVRKLFPQLEIIAQIGRGGMGVVYKARQPNLDRFVALKLLPTEVAQTPGFAERFAREARALARLSHPNIVAVHDSGNAGGHFYFIMEFVDGANLRQMIAAKQIKPEAALTIVPKVCEALQFAHDEGILHRDIKPENILIDKKGRVKIADFGLAKLVGDDTVDHSLTGTHQVMGTPRYMAPEQFESTKTVDHRADIYSLGVVFYEMLTGEIPMGRFVAPSKKVQVDVRIDEVVLRSLEREPSQRYQHVSDVKTGVENVMLHTARSGDTPAVAPKDADDRRVATPVIGISAGANFQPSEKPLDHRVTEVVTKGIPGWFNARAKWVQSLVQGVLMLVWLIGLLAFLSFSFRASSGPGQSEKIIAFGAPAPWLEIVNETMSFKWLIHPLAPSVVLALLGAAAAFLYEKIRRSRPGFDAEKDRRSTRRWLIAMGLVIAAIITAAVMLTMRKPTAAIRQAVITEDVSANEGAVSGVHRMFRYTASAPVDHRASFWVEYWRDGKLDKKAGLTGGQMRQVPSRAAFEGGFDFSLADGAKTSPEAAGQVRWDFFVSSRLRDWESSNGVMKVNNDASRGGHGDWIADPFAGLSVASSWSKTRKWNVAIGEPVTVLVLRGHGAGENLSAGLSDEDAKQGKATILVRARFDAVPPGERVEHSQTKTLDAEAVEKLGVPAPMPVAPGRPAVIREDAPGGATNKLFRDFRYRVNASANQRATFWVELWRDGALERSTGATGGQSYDPPAGKNFDGLFVFSVADAAEWGPGAAGQLIWDFTAESALFDGRNASANTKFKPTRSDALSANRKWIGNPFEDLEVRSSWSGKRSWTTVGGEPVTLLMLTGDAAGKAPDAVTDEATAKRSKVCLLLKVRFDHVQPENLKDSSGTRYLSADDIDYRGKPAAVPATDSRFVIAQDRAKVPATKTPGREEFAFTLSGPTGYTLNVWAEIWQEGRMSILGGLDYHIVSRGGQPIETPFALATTDGDVASVESKGMMRLDWGLDGAWNNNQWRTNIFKGMGAIHRSWDREPRTWNPRPGEAVTILSITGHKISEFRSAMSLFTEADLIKGWPNAAIIVRAQFTPAKPGEIRDGEGPRVGINGLLNRIGNGTIPFAQFEIAKQLGVDVSRCQMPAETRALLVAEASTKSGQESAVKMLGEFLSEVGYSTSNPDQRFVIEPMNALWWRARKGQAVSADALVAALETFIEDLNTGFRAVWWNKPEPIIKGEHGPELSDATAKLLKLTKPQHGEANKIFQKYAHEARALERRHTKIEKTDQGHVLVTISHYSTQCLALASNLVAELGGIVPQNILPAIRPGGLPAVVFGSAGECRQEIEMWREDGKYHLKHRQQDWIEAPGMIRSGNSFSNVGPDIGTFYGDYRLYWTEE